MQFSWKKLRKILIPEEPIGALMISDRLIQVFSFAGETNKIKYLAQFFLPSGIIEGGVLLKNEELEKILLRIKDKIWQSRKIPWVILSLPSANFFTNIISVPELPPKQFAEAVFFNIQTDHPVPLEKIYFDWEEIGTSLGKNHEKDVFFATGIKDNINHFLEAVAGAGFQVVAVEPFSLGVVRFLSNFGDKEKPYLSIILKLEGLEFILGINEQIIFMDFHFWSEVFSSQQEELKEPPKEINVALLEDYLLKQIPRFLNFYLLKYQKEIKHYLFLSPHQQINSLLDKIIEKEFNLQPLTLKLPPFLMKLSSDWYSVIGTALRGLISRSEDTIISLAPIGTEVGYRQHQLLNFISLWFKITAVTLLGLIMIFSSLDILMFGNLVQDYQEKTSIGLSDTSKERLAVLSQSAKEFNNLVQQAILADAFKQEWANILQEIFNSANFLKVDIKRIFVSGAPANNITIQAEVLHKPAMTNFKESLEKITYFSEVRLPLETLLETPGKGVSFFLNLKLKSRMY